MADDYQKTLARSYIKTARAQIRGTDYTAGHLANFTTVELEREALAISRIMWGLTETGDWQQDPEIAAEELETWENLHKCLIRYKEWIERRDAEEGQA